MTGLIPKKSEFKTHSQKKEPENSVFSDFESKYSTFTQLFFKCCTAITQIFTALEIQLSNTAQHTSQHFLYCAVLWGTRFHSGEKTSTLCDKHSNNIKNQQKTSNITHVWIYSYHSQLKIIDITC